MCWQRCLRFALIFGGVLLLQAMVNIMTAVAVHDANVWALVLMLWWAPAVGLLVVPSAAVSAVLRAVWLTWAPASVREADTAAVVAGAVAAPTGLLLIVVVGGVGFSDSGLTGPSAPLLPTMLVNGGVSGYLAHRQLSPRRGRWWGLVVASVIVGLVSWSLLEPEFPALP